MSEVKAKKQGWLALVRESMTKTGGCCGPGESCGGPAKPKGKETGENTATKEPEQDGKK